MKAVYHHNQLSPREGIATLNEDGTTYKFVADNGFTLDIVPASDYPQHEHIVLAKQEVTPQAETLQADLAAAVAANASLKVDNEALQLRLEAAEKALEEAKTSKKSSK